MSTETTTTQVQRVEKVPWFPWLGTRKRPFYGWVIVAAGAVEQFFQGIVSQGFTTYLGPLQAEFGWSRAVLASPRSVTQIESAILGPLQGYLVDRLGPRSVVAWGCVLVGAGLVLFGLVQSLWQYYLSSIIIDIGFAMAGMLVVSVAVNHWFRRRRTVAQSLFLMGYTAAGIIGVPIIVWLQAEYGWRVSAIASGVAVWTLGIPAAMLIRRSPEPYGLFPDGAPAPIETLTSASSPQRSSVSMTLREAMHTRTFWFLSVSNGLNGLAQSAMMVHLFLHLEHGVGLSRATAAFVWTVASLSNVPSRLVMGVLGDRLPKNLVLGACLTAMGAATLVLGFASSLPAALAFSVLYGIGWGGRTPLQNALHGQYWGLASLGKIVGTLQALAVPLSIAGPVLAGLIADQRGDYKLVLVTLSFASFLSAALVFLASQPRQTRVDQATEV